jgi:hypothetical protein
LPLLLFRAMPPKKAKSDEKKKDDKGDKDKKKPDAASVSDAIRFFPEQKRLERLEEENVRILLSFKGLHEQLRAQVLVYVLRCIFASYYSAFCPSLRFCNIPRRCWTRKTSCSILSGKWAPKMRRYWL